MISENYQVLTPAYGRDYRSAKDARAAFFNGDDFNLNSITYGFTKCSIRDFVPGTIVNIRYKRNMMVTSVRVE